ncbi:MAG TPA: heavy metal-associated domain-containing protein [Steroidobacteraceae bacterium]|nr:heavy metal-associated domain-containing protein [Steroidobacteraceae bacterium]
MATPASHNPAATVELSVSGMTCDGCASTVTRILLRVPGVTGARVDLAGGHASVAGTASAQELVAAVQAAGFGAQAP